MKFFDRLLTIIITATLTSAVWIVFGSAIFELAEGNSADEPEAVEAVEPAAPTIVAPPPAAPPVEDTVTPSAVEAEPTQAPAPTPPAAPSVSPAEVESIEETVVEAATDAAGDESGGG